MQHCNEKPNSCKVMNEQAMEKNPNVPTYVLVGTQHLERLVKNQFLLNQSIFMHALYGTLHLLRWTLDKLERNLKCNRLIFIK